MMISVFFSSFNKAQVIFVLLRVRINGYQMMSAINSDVTYIPTLNKIPFNDIFQYFFFLLFSYYLK